MLHALEVNAVSHWFGDNKVLNDVNLKVNAGQVVALVGPSGCGKSTLLRAILGTHPPKRGEILVDGRPVTGPTRDVGIVYQHYSLYDFLTAQQNVAFGLMVDQTSLAYRLFSYFQWRQLRQHHLRQSREFLEQLHLGNAVDLYPSEMSGGMRQRVAIAQALIMKPKLVLLDEPFGALDEAMREELQLMLLELYQENLAAGQRGERPPYTILIVTHELNEALYVGDRIVGLSQYHIDGANGATIVYDKSAPVFHPDDQRDYALLVEQREELRHAVFDAEHIKHHGQYVTFWSEYKHLLETAGSTGDRDRSNSSQP